jgi:hypothetical protein
MTAIDLSEMASPYGNLSLWERVRGASSLKHVPLLPTGEGEGGEHRTVEEGYYDLLVGRRREKCEEG